MKLNSINNVAFEGKIILPVSPHSSTSTKAYFYDENINSSDIDKISIYNLDPRYSVIDLKNSQTYTVARPLDKVLAAYNAAKDSDITISLNA